MPTRSLAAQRPEPSRRRPARYAERAGRTRRGALWRLGSSILVGLGTGCAVDIPTLDLARPESMERINPARTGVVPLVDRRAEIQREGEAPRLIPLLLWNQRKGEYVTADRHFEGDVSLALSRQVAAALDRGRFGPATLLEDAAGASRAGALARCRADDLPYVALGSIGDFYGTLRQNAYLFLLPIPFVSLIGFGNAKTDPLGVVTLDLEILDCQTGRPVFRRRLARRMRHPEESLSEAARLTLLDLLDQLSNETLAR